MVDKYDLDVWGARAGEARSLVEEENKAQTKVSSRRHRDGGIRIGIQQHRVNGTNITSIKNKRKATNQGF